MSVRGIVSFHDPRRLRLRWWSLRWAPVHRLDVGVLTTDELRTAIEEER